MPQNTSGTAHLPPILKRLLLFVLLVIVTWVVTPDDRGAGAEAMKVLIVVLTFGLMFITYSALSALRYLAWLVTEGTKPRGQRRERLAASRLTYVLCVWPTVFCGAYGISNDLIICSATLISLFMILALVDLFVFGSVAQAAVAPDATRSAVPAADERGNRAAAASDETSADQNVARHRGPVSPSTKRAE